METLYDGSHLNSVLNDVSVKLKKYLENDLPENVVFVGIITNGVFFAKRMQHKLYQHDFNIESPIMELDISLYRDDLAKRKDYISLGSSSIEMNLDNKHVILFDDVLSTARTARAALNAIFDYGRPKKVSFAVLFDRKNRQVPIEPNITGEVVNIDNSLRINVEFLEVVGDDKVVLGDMVTS